MNMVEEGFNGNQTRYRKKRGEREVDMRSADPAEDVQHQVTSRVGRLRYGIWGLGVVGWGSSRVETAKICQFLSRGSKQHSMRLGSRTSFEPPSKAQHKRNLGGAIMQGLPGCAMGCLPWSVHATGGGGTREGDSPLFACLK